ncbi:D-alanyl-D-alanine carboxypeptidase/D-alanyl-D-alanine-endopeptidase, partial [candidate division WOR-3 bacterium]
LAIYDGSGLSRFNRITPLAMVRLLYALYHSRYREQFLSLLPTGGEGTLWYRFKTEKNRIRCKTGTLYGVSCLSGYILKPRPIAFAILINDFLTPRRDIEKWQESLCRRYLQ